MDAVLQALSDESRRTVLETLRRGPATVGELAALLPIARPGVSRHLRVLREAGLVEVHHQAQWRVYRLRPEPLAEGEAWISRYREFWEERLDDGKGAARMEDIYDTDVEDLWSALTDPIRLA